VVLRNLKEVTIDILEGSLFKLNKRTGGLTMVSRILVIADATKEAVGLILESLKTIHNDQLHIKALFISFLSGVSLKNIGPNILTLLTREKEEALQRARHYFTINDIPYDIRMMPGSDWQVISKEIEGQEHNILIIQGEFAKIWRKDHPSTYGLGTITELTNPVWIIGEPEDPHGTSVRP